MIEFLYARRFKAIIQRTVMIALMSGRGERNKEFKLQQIKHAVISQPLPWLT